VPRDRERATGQRAEDAPARSERRSDNPVLELQRAAGNRAVGQILARKGSDASAGPTIKLGKFSIDVSGGNIAAWAAGGDVPDALDVTSHKGRHSAELEHLSKDHTRTTLTLTVPDPGKGGEHLDLGSLAIEIVNAHIKSYAVDGDAESWRVADFDAVHRTKTGHKVGEK
jgi:hypothetical protein